MTPTPTLDPFTWLDPLFTRLASGDVPRPAEWRRATGRVLDMVEWKRGNPLRAAFVDSVAGSIRFVTWATDRLSFIDRDFRRALDRAAAQHGG